MLKLTRLNHHLIAINPDHIATVEAQPDTTICLLGGDKIIVRESLDDLIEAMLLFRRATHTPLAEHVCFPEISGDPPHVTPAKKEAQ